MPHYVLVQEIRVKRGEESENKPSGGLSRKTTILQRRKEWLFPNEALQRKKIFFHFISALPSLIVRLIKKELALDFLQMFLSKQINLCGINIENFSIFFPLGCVFYGLRST